MKGTPPGRRQYSSRWVEEEQTGVGRGSVFEGHHPGGVGEIKTYGEGVSHGGGCDYKLAICSTWNIVLAMLYVLSYRYIDG